MPIALKIATVEDVVDLVALRSAVNERLTAQYGEGYWASRLSEAGALFAMRNSSVYVARYRGKLIATLALSTSKPWAIDPKYFSSSQRPLYLTAMSVHPDRQRKGVGRGVPGGSREDGDDADGASGGAALFGTVG